MTDSHRFKSDLNNDVRCDHCGAHITDARHRLDLDFPRAIGEVAGNGAESVHSSSRANTAASTSSCSIAECTADALCRHATFAADAAGMFASEIVRQYPTHPAALLELPEAPCGASYLAPMRESAFLQTDGEQHDFSTLGIHVCRQ